MLKTYTTFMRFVNYDQAGIDLWTNVAKNATDAAQREYCKAMINVHQEAIDGLCVTYPIFATLYKLNKARSAS